MADDVPAFDRRRPFTRADAVAAGIAPKLLRGSSFRRVFRGVYVDAAVADTPRLRVEAALKVVTPLPNPDDSPTVPAAFASHASAARIYELPIPTLPGDNLVRTGRLTVTELVAHCAAWSGPCAVAARRAASYVRARVDSPMETRLRMLLVLSGLPEPEINFKIRAVHGELLRR